MSTLDNSSLKQAKILIVDDQAANVKVLEKTLEIEGYESLCSTTDPREGVEMYAAQKYDLVLLDLNMPYMDGFEVMDRLRAIDPDDYTPVLVLTAQMDRDSRIKALEKGARDFLTKPFDILELVNRIRNMLEVRLLHNMVKDQNEILEQKVRERTHEIHKTRLEIIRRLGRAAEYRDNETGLHIVRMSKMSATLAACVGLDKRECELILNASPMHDVGKIGIPDHVLLKPGKFEPQEWEVMKTHAEIGAQILSGHDSELLEAARVIALSHHEKWDGSGYPNALRGEEIPLFGRIVAVADVFDALTSKRPYKRAWSIDEAVEYMRANRGSHFAPDLVDCFMDLLPIFIEIKQTYAEPGAK